MTTNAAPTGWSRHFILVMMTLAYVVNYLDRNILAILLPQIKAEFGLSDTDLGLLSGTVFAIVYATLGIPLAILADRYSRRNIVALSMGLFSLMTVLCGYAQSFIQLLLARIGTGVGEAGTTPSINSMISDLYKPHERAAALSFYAAGLNIGLLLAYFGGGWIAENYGWRNAFLAAGLPGLILTVLFFLFISEPKRGHAESITDSGQAPGPWETAKFLWTQSTFRWIAFATSMTAFGGYIVITFKPAFFSRTYDLTQTEIGIILALTAGILGGLGTYFAGVIADRYGKNDVRWYMYVAMYAALIALPFLPFQYLSPTVTGAVAAMLVPSLLGAAYLGSCLAVTQGLAPLRMRAQAPAILLFILNMFGLGLGPLVAGKVSDLLHPSLGEDSLRWAMFLCVAVSFALSAFGYWRASISLKGDLARVQGNVASATTH